VSININTHDPQNKSVYYRWEYDETYEIHSFFTAYIKYENGNFVPILPGENFNVCYKSSSSTGIVLGSSAKLQSDIISQVPIIFINASELPGWFYKQACSLIYAPKDSVKPFIDAGYLVVNVKSSGFTLFGYYFSDRTCVDCRFRGGILTKPSFW